MSPPFRTGSGLTRRGFLAASLGAVAAGPSAWARALPDRAQALVDRAWQGLDPARVLDAHVHIVGIGTGGTGCWVNPRLRMPVRHPGQFARYRTYLKAGGVRRRADADQRYVEVLLERVRSQPLHGRVLALAFDWAHDDDGRPRPEDSSLYTPNDYVLRLADRHPDVFVPVASIHPLRPDALDELLSCAEAGAVAVKWLPNAQRIDPADVRCEPFYRAMSQLGLPLITHGGDEQAVEADRAQHLGNPMRLRRALDAGVRVVVAHVASTGVGEDPDDPSGRPASAFDLYRRLAGAFPDRVYGGISSLLQANRCGRPLRETLAGTDDNPALVNGSDYPLPAIDLLVRTRLLAELGYLERDDAHALEQLFEHNPLQFDFVAKRTLRCEGKGFPDSAFCLRPELFPRFG